MRSVELTLASGEGFRITGDQAASAAELFSSGGLMLAGFPSEVQAAPDVVSAAVERVLTAAGLEYAFLPYAHNSDATSVSLN